jgi:hypothetical protein
MGAGLTRLNRSPERSSAAADHQHIHIDCLR